MKSPGRNQMAKRIAPGIWEDVDGHVHFSIPELLQLVDLPDTPENQARVLAMAKDVFAKHAPQTKIHFRQTPAD